MVEQDTYFTIRVDLSTMAELKRLAKVNDRTASAEVRRAIKEYLAKQQAAAA